PRLRLGAQQIGERESESARAAEPQHLAAADLDGATESSAAVLVHELVPPRMIPVSRSRRSPSTKIQARALLIDVIPMTARARNGEQFPLALPASRPFLRFLPIFHC